MFFKKTVGYLIGFGFIAYIFWAMDFDWSKLELLSVTDILLLSLASIVLLIMNAFGAWLQLAIFGFKIPWAQAFHVSQFYNLLNYLPLKAGLIGEGLWLKKNYSLPYKKFVASIAFTYIANFFVYAIVILVIFAFFRDPSSIFSIVRPLYVIYFLIAVITLGIGYFFTPKSIAFRKNLSLLFQDRVEILKAKRYVLLLFIILPISLFVTAFRLIILFGVLGYSLSWPGALLMSVLASFSFLVAFTPGGLGIREGFLGAMSFILFQNVTAGAIVSMIIRIIEFIWIGIFGTYGFHRLNQLKSFKLIDNKEKDPENTSS